MQQDERRSTAETAAGPRGDYETLAGLLEKRLAVIADTAFRDRDPEAHLEALKTVSEDLAAQHERLKGRIPARLNHFLSQCSYQKALDYVREELSSGAAERPAAGPD